ncbi:MAG: hypothetical protein LBB82_08095 [Treponema sp.]|jgi:hypothetical protein|nr:hypothetical protein [Treponema sp.]
MIRRALKKTLYAFILLAAAFTAAGAGNDDEKNIVVLDDKGAAFDMNTPAWVKLYLAGGNAAVEKTEQYKSKYCFVVLVYDAGKNYAISAANNISNAVDNRNISFSGVRKEADWWQLVKNKKTNTLSYRAFTLWTREK